MLLCLLGKKKKRGRMGGLYGKCIFNFKKKCPMVSQSGSTLPPFFITPAVYKSLILSTPLSTLGMVIPFHFSHSGVSISVYHCGLICIFSVKNDAEYLFICSFSICISPSGKYLRKSFVPLLHGLFIFLSLSCTNGMWFYGYMTISYNGHTSYIVRLVL